MKDLFKVIHGLWLLAFVGLVSAAYDVSANTRRMELWSETNPAAKASEIEAWLRNPTFHQTYKWDDPSRKPGYRDGLYLSNVYFNWVMEELAKLKASNKLSKRIERLAVIVSTMYDPVTDTFESSTIPRGSRKAWMMTHTEFTPIWKAATARTGKNVKGEDYTERYAVGAFDKQGNLQYPYCAEDGMAFNFEMRERLESLKGEKTFSKGSFVAVWGSTNPTTDKKGRELYPCLVKAGTPQVERYGDRGMLGCTTTLNNLGVAIRLPDEVTKSPLYMNPWQPITAYVPGGWDKDWVASWFDTDLGLPWEPMNQMDDSEWHGGGGWGYKHKRDGDGLRTRIEGREPVPEPRKKGKKPQKGKGPEKGKKPEKGKGPEKGKTPKKSSSSKHSTVKHPEAGEHTKTEDHPTSTGKFTSATDSGNPKSIDTTQAVSDLEGLWPDDKTMDSDAVSGAITLTGRVSVPTASLTAPTSFSTVTGPLSSQNLATSGEVKKSEHGSKAKETAHHTKETKSK